MRAILITAGAVTWLYGFYFDYLLVTIAGGALSVLAYYRIP